MTSAARDIADYLAANGVGTIGTDVNAHREPPTPNDTVTVYATGGLPGDLDNDFFRPTIQIRVRCVNPEQGMERLESIVNILGFPVSFEQGDWRYIGVGTTTEPEPIGFDDKQRALIVQNFQIMREHRST